ncbi:uncharacterized protein AMSG_02102 [Thecamonas trahens ATCC 50062]|uniref:MYND-type domain-containing protein n=1 Tax=Thecamonas trahens ATCC 50062 TaxID=461836 RepID=A0A0L0DUX3_THETB|nr:hypothetical protein AMSG_02102 [Thecamonas trahens ATCC 50062]KNC56089.1 hypothetical protein AMSG_02102 [Thecamonas trahens ATCC 50062]|eukprot:XP_013761131.1 hypothetical protein AMSG_02102 [Thecamonas trahens ATCC 50062]
MHKLLASGTEVIVASSGTLAGEALLRLVVGGGAGAEPPEVPFLSALVPHLLVQASTLYGPGDVDSLMAAWSTSLNVGALAYATVHLDVIVPFAAVDKAIALLANLVRHPAYTVDHLHDAYYTLANGSSAEGRHELTAVGLRDSGSESLGETRLAELGDAISANPDEVIAAADAFYAKWYTPSNMALVVVGDVEPERVISLASAWFGPSDDRACVLCGKHGRRCSSCRGPTYCSSACQNRHWAKHKARCTTSIAPAVERIDAARAAVASNSIAPAARHQASWHSLEDHIAQLGDRPRVIVMSGPNDSVELIVRLTSLPRMSAPRRAALRSCLEQAVGLRLAMAHGAALLSTGVELRCAPGLDLAIITVTVADGSIPPVLHSLIGVVSVLARDGMLDLERSMAVSVISYHDMTMTGLQHAVADLTQDWVIGLTAEQDYTPAVGLDATAADCPDLESLNSIVKAALSVAPSQISLHIAFSSSRDEATTLFRVADNLGVLQAALAASMAKYSKIVDDALEANHTAPAWISEAARSSGEDTFADAAGQLAPPSAVVATSSPASQLMGYAANSRTYANGMTVVCMALPSMSHEVALMIRGSLVAHDTGSAPNVQACKDACRGLELLLTERWPGLSQLHTKRSMLGVSEISVELSNTDVLIGISIPHALLQRFVVMLRLLMTETVPPETPDELDGSWLKRQGKDLTGRIHDKAVKRQVTKARNALSHGRTTSLPKRGLLGTAVAHLFGLIPFDETSTVSAADVAAGEALRRLAFGTPSSVTVSAVGAIDDDAFHAIGAQYLASIENRCASLDAAVADAEALGLLVQDGSNSLRLTPDLPPGEEVVVEFGGDSPRAAMSLLMPVQLFDARDMVLLTVWTHLVCAQFESDLRGYGLVGAQWELESLDNATIIEYPSLAYGVIRMEAYTAALEMLSDQCRGLIDRYRLGYIMGADDEKGLFTFSETAVSSSIAHLSVIVGLTLQQPRLWVEAISAKNDMLGQIDSVYSSWKHAESEGVANDELAAFAARLLTSRIQIVATMPTNTASPVARAARWFGRVTASVLGCSSTAAAAVAMGAAAAAAVAAAVLVVRPRVFTSLV